MAIVFTEAVALKMVLIECYKCGLQFGLTERFEQARRNDHETLYCPVGHAQAFCVPSEAERLRSQLADEKGRNVALVAARNAAYEQAEHERRERSKLQTRHRNLKLRGKHGVCPCCKRQFGNVRNHMRTEHPNFASED